MLLQKSGGIKVIKKIKDTFLKVFKNIFVCYQQFVSCTRARKRSTSMTSTTTSSAVAPFFQTLKATKNIIFCIILIPGKDTPPTIHSPGPRLVLLFKGVIFVAFPSKVFVAFPSKVFMGWFFALGLC